MMTRAERARMARETLDILKEGFYRAPSGEAVHIQEAVDFAKSHSRLYTPEDFDEVFSLRDNILERVERRATEFDVTNETTLSAAARLVRGGNDVLALNFASAKNPGGGFLKGSQAQEESLARSSGLYRCIARMTEMYEANRRFRSPLYTDHMVYSPRVPVFRDDSGRLLESPYVLSIITAPAVNAGAVRRSHPEAATQIEPVMLSRIEKVLSLAVVHGHRQLVLGAWGCGVFRNTPRDVACWFSHYLTGDGLFTDCFDKVVFAVLDSSPGRVNVGAFEKVFGRQMSC